ncbi:MAG: phenylalanine--tRNA ligase subunit alpha [Bacteroidia bacterium]|nr:phenylalanine--tRNA ligase subunit alpha [Bacteroidia bacterium]
MMDSNSIDMILDDIDKFEPSSAEELEQFRISYLGKKGIITNLFSELRNVEQEKRKEAGKLLNELKTSAEDVLQRFAHLSDETETTSAPNDLSLPAEPISLGSKHPVSIIRDKIVNIFSRIGFTVSEGPEIEDDWHNFSALNFPPNHPAREMQDTFFLSKNPDIALRTHTSSVQVRVMENSKPPIRTISPGRVYRNEAISARAHCFFHQVEGLYIDEKVSFADLKQTLYLFVHEMFGTETKTRFRPSYFPFTEPSAEMDISCLICYGSGCAVCKHSGWVEILGCGMVHPSVLDNCKIDSSKFTGFAFGMGIERIVMLKYGIGDIRILFENDKRFLQQFVSAD